jgi:hypothetical protein
LSEEFWRHVAAMNGEGLPPEKSKFALGADTLILGRSYATVERDGRRLCSLPRPTLTRALVIRRERLTMIENAAREEREAARIQWGD